MMNGAAKFAAPSSVAPVRGCSSLWDHIFSRVLKGTGTTFFVAFATLLLGGTIGVLVGAFTGYFGGWIDEILMRINDVIVSFPGILLALVFIALLGPGKYNVILALVSYSFRGRMYHRKKPCGANFSHARYGLCQKCPSDGCFPSSDHICTYPAKYGPVPSFDGSNRFQQRRSLRGRHELSRHRCPAARCLAWTDALRIPDVSDDCSLGLSVFPGLAVILLALGVSLLGDGLQKKGGN